MREKTDEELLAGISRGDRDAGEEFFLRYRKGAYRTAYRLLGNEADALDVVEDAFVKLLKAAGKFRGEAKAKTWFYRILMNTAYDARRKRGRFVALESGDDDEESPKDRLPSREEQPGKALERKETFEKIQEAIAGLSEKHRKVFVLTAVEGLSYKETADVLEISQGTVMSRLFYARKYLQDSLRSYVEAENE